MPFLNTFGAASAKSFGLSRKKGAVGQATYTTCGSYSMTVPSGATKMSIVMIGGGYDGGGGAYCGYAVGCACICCRIYTFRYSYAQAGSGGAGGTLRYKNCISVTSGQTVSITVAKGTSSVSIGGVSVGYDVSYAGGYGGNGGYVESGGWGAYLAPQTGGGGGSAGGYTAAGANGPNSSQVYGGNTNLSGPGVGAAAGGGGYGGNAGTNYSYAGVSGSGGGVRIVWTYAGGPTRQFPSTNVGCL